MRINAVTNNVRSYPTFNKQSKSVKAPNNDYNSKNVQLPGYNLTSGILLSQQIPFTASSDFNRTSINKVNERYIQEIANAEAELDVLKSPNENPLLNVAIKENEFYEDFEKNRSTYYNQACSAADKVERNWRDEHNSWYRFWHQSELERLRGNEFKSYNNMWTRFKSITPRYETNNALIEAANKNEEERNKRILELKKFIDHTKKLIDYNSLQDTINTMLTGNGSLDSRIAGYSATKNQIRNFIELLQGSIDNPGIQVPPCVVLYGATGTGKTTFLKAIESMAEGQVDIIRFDENSKESFMTRFRKAMDWSRNNYNENKRRTILLMDDAEKYFCMLKGDAKAHYMDEMDEDDIARLEKINDDKTNENVKDFKSILDDLSKVPDTNEPVGSNKAAMSIFITTNHPNLIDRQLIKRPEKMDAFHVGPASGEDLNAVVKFYFEDKKPIIDAIKMFKGREDSDDAINGLTGISIDAKNNIKRMLKDGSIDKLKIDADTIDYNFLTRRIQPSDEKGAYSNVLIKNIAHSAFNKYLVNPKQDYTIHFYNELRNTARDIEPQRYKRYLETVNYVNLFKQTPEIDSINDSDFMEMLIDSNHNMLLDEEKNKLNQYIVSLEDRYEELKDKQQQGILSEDETVELETCTRRISYIKDPALVEEYYRTHYDY